MLVFDPNRRITVEEALCHPYLAPLHDLRMTNPFALIPSVLNLRTHHRLKTASMWETIVLFSKQFPASWSYIKIQKTMLNRFWHFLRNGCYGSQHVSYPVLVLFIDTLPLEAIAGEKFFLEFFQNLWAGWNSYHPSSADRQAFFLALKECFLWALHSVLRYEFGIT